MRIRGTDNRTLKDDFKSRRQLIVIRVNGWTDRGRNEKTKQPITRTGKQNFNNLSIFMLGKDKRFSFLIIVIMIFMPRIYEITVAIAAP